MSCTAYRGESPRNQFFSIPRPMDSQKTQFNENTRNLETSATELNYRRAARTRRRAPKPCLRIKDREIFGYTSGNEFIVQDRSSMLIASTNSCPA